MIFFVFRRHSLQLHSPTATTKASDLTSELPISLYYKTVSVQFDLKLEWQRVIVVVKF